MAAFSGSVDNGCERFRAHEIRAWASSLAWHNNTSLFDIMEAAFWTSPATFLEFYLRDISHTKQDGSKGISFVADHHLHKVQGTQVCKTLGKPAIRGVLFYALVIQTVSMCRNKSKF